MTSLLKSQWFVMPPAALLPAAGAQLAANLHSSNRLWSVAGWTALLTGALLGKLERHGDAYSQFALAEALARDAGDSTLLARVLVKRRGLLYWRNAVDPHRALELLDTAASATGPAGPPLLRTMILASRAEDQATLGDEAGCLRDLEAAEGDPRPSRDREKALASC